LAGPVIGALIPDVPPVHVKVHDGDDPVPVVPLVWLPATVVLGVEIDRAAVEPWADPPLCIGRAPVAAAAAVPRPNSATVAAEAALAVRTLEIMLFLFEREVAVRRRAAEGTRVLDTIAAAMEATAPSPASSDGEPGAWAALTSEARRE